MWHIKVEDTNLNKQNRKSTRFPIVNAIVSLNFIDNSVYQGRGEFVWERGNWVERWRESEDEKVMHFCLHYNLKNYRLESCLVWPIFVYWFDVKKIKKRIQLRTILNKNSCYAALSYRRDKGCFKKSGPSFLLIKWKRGQQILWKFNHINNNLCLTHSKNFGSKSPFLRAQCHI